MRTEDLFIDLGLIITNSQRTDTTKQYMEVGEAELQWHFNALPLQVYYTQSGPWFGKLGKTFG